MIASTTIHMTKPKGYLNITNNWQLAVYGKRPNWFHRTMMRLLLGWTWEEYKE